MSDPSTPAGGWSPFAVREGRAGSTGSTGRTGRRATGRPDRTEEPLAAEATPAAALAARVIGAIRTGVRWTGIQPPGWILIVVVIGCAIAGGPTGWVELRIAAVAGAVIMVAAVLFTLGRQTYDVQVRLQSEQVEVGQRALGDLQVVNTSDRRLLPARIELPVGRRLASFALPSLPARASHEEVFAVPTNRRAVITVGPARTVRGDPFGLMGRELLWTGAVDLFVHPRTVRIPGRQGGFIRDLEGQTTDTLTDSDVSFHALREYVPGDDRRHVHWKSTAKTGTLLVRQFEETRRSHLALGLDLGIGSYDTDEEFELAVSVTASLALQAVRDESFLTLLTNDRSARGAARLRSVTAKRTLDELSTVEQQARGDVFGLARWMLRGEPNASLASLVTGQAMDPRGLRRAGALFGPDIRVLAIRCESGAVMTVQTTDNISVITLGALADLPRALRRASLGDA